MRATAIVTEPEDIARVLAGRPRPPAPPRKPPPGQLPLDLPAV